MNRCTDCGERIATWEDYCPKCGARKMITGKTKEVPQAKKKKLGLFSRLRRTP
ncbi:MAG: hypothetical protein GX998_11895 [Firmicutes bacterium]|nr:hypothetical protein [Bacillota bacterium]